MAMYELNGDRPFADSAGHPLHRAMTDVAYCKHAWDAGFQHERIAVRGPAWRPLAVAHHFRSRQDEAARVPLDEAVQPVGARLRADKNEKAGRGHRLHGSRAVAGDRNRLQLRLTVHGY